MDTLIGVVPDGWSVCTLGERYDVKSGPSGEVLKTVDYVRDGIPVVRAANIGDGIVQDATRTVTAETAARLSRYRLSPGDVVLVRIGATTRFTTVSHEHAGWVLGSSGLRLRVRPGPGRPEPGYLACYLAHPAVQGWLSDQTRHASRPTLRAETLSKMPLVVPPKAVQETVIATAQAIDAKINAHEQVIHATKALRGLLLQQVLTNAAPR